MPIARELKPLYRTPEARASTKRCLEAAGYRCQECGKPHMVKVWTLPGGLWFDSEACQWRAPAGKLSEDLMLIVTNPETVAATVLVKVGGAHLDHNPANNAASNRRALCQRCHFVHDRVQHKKTRSIHKDQARPLLASLEVPS